MMETVVCPRFSLWRKLCLALIASACVLLTSVAQAVQYQIVYVPVTVVINGKPVVIRRPVVRPIATTTKPACGLSAPAFCDTFDKPALVHGRAGELDANKWSGARLQPGLVLDRAPFAITAGTMPPCRADLPTTVFPDQDTVICNSTASIKSSHLMVVAAAQHYGQNSYRIRQPFDFAGRTGRIVADVEANVINGLLGWISIDISEDPSPTPGFSFHEIHNDEGTQPPRNGVEIEFQSNCIATGNVPGVALAMVNVSHNYQQINLQPDQFVCVPTKEGNLNHVEIRLSQTHVEVYLTPYSSDGVSFPASQLLFSGDINLPFTRGYVHISTHNHATRKYSNNGDYGTTHFYDAWVARWDNVGFDGPVISNTREYEIPNAVIPGANFNYSGVAAVGIGYPVADADAGPEQVLRFQNVDLTNIKSARMALSFWSVRGLGDASKHVLRYRLNGKSFHDVPFSADELAELAAGYLPATTTPIIDVPLSDLVPGTNTLEFVTANVNQGYAPGVGNIDLILTP